MNLQEFRQKYPQYNEVDNDTLVNKLHNKYYSKVPKETFYEKIGYQPKEAESPLISGAKGFTTKFDRVFHGILQPLLESGYLGKNISESSKNVAKEREKGYEEAKRLNPKATTAGSFMGELGLQLPGMVAGGGGLLSSVLAGGLGGAARGAAEYAQPNESRTKKAISEGLTGAAFGALPAIGSKALKTGKSGLEYARNIPKAYPAEKLAEKILTDRKNIENTYKKGYQSFLKDTRNDLISTDYMPKIKINTILQNATKKESRILNKFLENRNIETAHRAQSDLGKLISRLNKKESRGGLLATEHDTLEAAIKGQKNIRQAMKNSLEASGKSEKGKLYSELTKGYEKEVIPYKNKIISEYKKGEITSEDFVKSLGKQKKFRAELKEKYPEMHVRETLPNRLTYGGLGAGATYLGLPQVLYKKLLSE